MRWSSGLSTATRLENALRDAAATVHSDLGGPPDLLLAFISHHHWQSFDLVPDLVRSLVRPRFLLGCSAGGVIGDGHEVEHRAAVALMGARLPGVTITPFHFNQDDVPQPGAPAAAWQHAIAVAEADDPNFILLPDPYTIDVQSILDGLDRAWPRAPKVGGLASGGTRAGTQALFHGGEVSRGGIAGVALCGDIEVDTVVAQGCRPIGPPLFVTRTRENLVYQLDGRMPAEVIGDIYQGLDAEDRELFQRTLLIGVTMQDAQELYREGDFLVRNVLGLDSESGALAIGTRLRENAVVQFHLRDAATSDEELTALLQRYNAESVEAPPTAALLFSCMGRGQQLYGVEDHDVAALRAHVGEIPVGGFFCGGEIGPVHGRTYLHGYTSSIGIVRPRQGHA